MKRFLPLCAFLLLPLYCFIALYSYTPAFEGDEGRYVLFAKNLAEGYYSPPGEVRLWNGPGYPLLLAPLAWFQLSWLWGVLLNPILLFLAVLYFFALIRFYLVERSAILLGLLFGLYPPFLRELNRLLSETFTIFLMTAFLYHMARALRQERQWLHLTLAGCLFGFLCLTKVIFGYLALLALLSFGLVVVVRRSSFTINGCAIAAIALGICAPYLIYVYSLTGRIFYWSTAGGLQLYCMTSPVPAELGSWFTTDLALAGEFPQIAQHRPLFESLVGLSELERDDILKREALNNLRRQPLLYAKRVVVNMGRLLFSYPYTATAQTPNTYLYIVPNMFLVVLGILALPPAIKWWRQLTPEVLLAVMLFGGAFLLSALVSAYERQFRPLVPAVAIWLVFMYTRLIQVHFGPIEKKAGGC